MKYIFTLWPPFWKIVSTVRTSSASVTSLLMALRIRWEPASGAIVKPPFLIVANAFAISGLRVFTRRLGIEVDTIWAL